MLKIKFILLFLLTANLYGAGYDANADVNENWARTYSDDPRDREIYDVTIDTVLEGIDLKESERKRLVEIKNELMKNKNTLMDQFEFFQPYFQYSTKDLVCPPLKEELNTHLDVIINSVNYKNSTINCSVILNYQSSVTPGARLDKLIVLKDKTFTNKLHSQYIDNINTQNIISEEAEDASILFSEKLQEIKTVARLKYQKTNDTVKYLDQADLFDNLFMLNADIIDIDASYKQKSIVLQNGYAMNYDREEKILNTIDQKERYNTVDSSIISNFIFDDSDRYEEKIEASQNKISKSVDKVFNIFIDFIVDHLGYFINNIQIGFFFALIGLAAYRLIAFFYNHQLSKESNWKLLGPVLTVFIAIALFINNKTKISDDIEIPLNNIQSVVILANNFTNSLVDELTLSFIDVFVSNMFTDKHSSLEEIQSITSANERLKNAKADIVNFDYQCLNTFDIFLYQNDKFFIDNKIDFNKNPFIPEEIFQKKLGNFFHSVYNNSNQGGYLKDHNAWNINKISVDSCYNNRQSLNIINNQIDKNNLLIASFNSLDYQDEEYQRRSILIEQLYSGFYQNGYLAISSLPVVKIYIDLIENIDKKQAEYENMLTNKDPDDFIKFSLENSFLSLTFGSSIFDYSSKLLKGVTDLAIGWIPLGIGQALSNASATMTAFATTNIAVDSLEMILPLIRSWIIMILSLFMFAIFFIGKFIIFWSIQLFIMYVLISSKPDKSLELLTKVIFVFVKLFVFVFVVFFTMTIMDFIHIWIYVGIEEMTIMLAANGWLITSLSYFNKGLVEFLVLLAEMVVTYKLLWNFTPKVVAFFGVKGDEITDGLSEMVSSSIENRIVK